MSERTLVLHKAESFQVPAIIADVGPEATKRSANSYKEKKIPVHHKLEEILDEYLKVSKLRERPDTPLFPTTLGKSRELGSRPMTRFDGANLLKRRLKDAGIVADYSPHSFRATGITNYLENGGTLEGRVPLG